ncbi:MAG: Omp28-related outer membrane protein [Muribaculaceae bacterium]|nr:Omp28-related outer membrane protein [Muribaculaceae bacterium]
MSKYTIPSAITAIMLASAAFTAQGAAPLAFRSEIPAITPVGQPLQVYGRVVNESDDEVEGFTLAIRIGGEEYVNEYPTRILMPGSGADISWRTDFIPDGSRTLDYTVSVATAGNQPAETSGTLFARTRRWVVEESTGTWCANCPVGIYTLERLREEMPDTFIPIALHTGNDPMVAPDWQLTLFTTDTSAPYVMVNRTRGCHPVNLSDELALMERQGLRASFEEASCTLDGDEVSVDASVMFDAPYSAPATDMRIGCFIVENDVHVEEADYCQQNAFSGSGQLPGWNELPSVVSAVDMWYQHVGRGYSMDVAGVPGSLPADVEAGRVYSFSHAFALPGNVLEAGNCHLVLMVIDARSGSVLNGLELPLGGSYSGIGAILPDSRATDLTAPASSPVWYDLQGRRVSADRLVPGIYIRLADGRAERIRFR